MGQTNKYVCDFRQSPADADLYVSAIEAVFPHLNQTTEVDSVANPTIPVGRCRVTVPNCDEALHGEIMQIPGVELFSGNVS